MLSLATVLALALPTFGPLPICDGTPHVSFDVTASHGPIAQASDFSLAQLRNLAKQIDRIGKHPPWGFYYGAFRFTVHAEADPARQGCPDGLRIAVNVLLFDRQIELARELDSQPCLLALVREHYAKHAALDDTLLTDYANALEAALREVPLATLKGESPASQILPEQIESEVHEIVSSGLASLDAARKRTSDAVDSPEELNRLAAACP
jgi:hypothetical protein